MKQWWGRRSRMERWMIVIAALLVVCIATRWEWVFGQIKEAVQVRFGG